MKITKFFDSDLDLGFSNLSKSRGVFLSNRQWISLNLQVKNNLLDKSPKEFYMGYGPAYNAYLDAMTQKVYARWFVDARRRMTGKHKYTLTWVAYEDFKERLGKCSEQAVKVIKSL